MRVCEVAAEVSAAEGTALMPARQATSATDKIREAMIEPHTFGCGEASGGVSDPLGAVFKDRCPSGRRLDNAGQKIDFSGHGSRCQTEAPRTNLNRDLTIWTEEPAV
jgi:hypothetical protein